MTDPTKPQPGTSLSRAALERVLARATQLQAAAGDGDDAGAMTEEQLVALGKEVGISGDVLRQALAEERSRTLVPEESGMLAGIAGPAAVSAARTVPGSASAVLGALDGLMQRNEGLEVKRRFSDQLVWEARRDFFSAVRRTLNIAGSGLELAEANGVSAIVADVGAGRSHVRIAADFSATRARRATTAIALGLALIAIATLPLLATNIPPWLGLIPSAIVAGIAWLETRRRFRHLVARAQVALEQALDRLEFSDSKPPTTAQVLLESFLGQPRPK